MEDALKALGKKIYTARKAKKMSRAELGKLTGLHETTIKRYEDGEIKSPNLEKISAFAEALNLDYEELADWWIPKKSPNLEAVENVTKELYRVMHTANPDFSQAAVIDLNGESTDIWQNLIRFFSSLNDAGRTKALEYLDDLKEHPKYKDNTGRFNRYCILTAKEKTTESPCTTAEEVSSEAKNESSTFEELTSALKEELNNANTLH